MGHPHTEKCNPHTATQTLCGCTNPKALNAPRDKETQIHSGSEMHRHWSTDATLKARTAGQGGTHKS